MKDTLKWLIKIALAIVVTSVLFFIFNLPLPETIDENKKWVIPIYPYAKWVILAYFPVVIFGKEIYLIKSNTLKIILGIILGFILGDILGFIFKKINEAYSGKNQVRQLKLL